MEEIFNGRSGLAKHLFAAYAPATPGFYEGESHETQCTDFMKPIQFQSAKYKLRRANQLLLELTKMLDDFYAKQQSHSLTVRKIGSQYVVYATAAKLKLPYEFSLILGDIAHNVRTAFDHVVVSFTKERDNLQLPVGEKREDVLNNRHYKFIKEHFSDFADYILDKLEPYKFGKLSIWEVGKLDNLDKHNLLIPTNSLLRVQNIIVIDANNNVHHGIMAELDHGEVVSLQRFNAPITLVSGGEAYAALTFTEPPILAGASCLGVFEDCIPKSFEAINALEFFSYGKITEPNTLE